MITMDVLLTPPVPQENPWSRKLPDPSSSADAGDHDQNPRYVPLAAFDSYPGLWNHSFSTSPPAVSPAWKKLLESPATGRETRNSTTALPHPNTNALEPPKIVSYFRDWDDDVSLLNDDPDDDDIEILPQPTYDVLATLFDELYIADESEVEPDGDEEDDDGGLNGARAA